MQSPTRMAYWLLPEEPELTKYRALVSEFASKMDCPVFDPHATIYHGPYDLNDPFGAILETLSRYKTLELKVKELRFGDRFNQSCLIEFEKSDQLLEMRHAILNLIATDDNPNDFPHMSLIYGVLSDVQKSEILERVELPKSIKFSSVRIVANRARVVTREDVEYWHERGSVKLGTGTS